MNLAELSLTSKPARPGFTSLGALWRDCARSGCAPICVRAISRRGSPISERTFGSATQHSNKRIIINTKIHQRV